jgi:hypothetical protein
VSGEAQSPDKIEFHFAYDPAHRVFPATGVWGGAAGMRHLLVSFFVEVPEPPESVTHRMEAFELKDEIAREPQPGHPVLQRRLQTSVFLTTDTAKVVAQWLLDRVRELESLSDGTASGEGE